MFYDLCGIFLCIHDLCINLMIEILTQVCVNLMILSILWWTQVLKIACKKYKELCHFLTVSIGAKVVVSINIGYQCYVGQAPIPTVHAVCHIDFQSYQQACLLTVYAGVIIDIGFQWHVLLIVYFCSSFLSCQLTCMKWWKI